MLLASLCKKCGDNIFVGPNVEIKYFENLILEDNISIHRFCYLDAIGGINIGKNVSIAHNCSILSFNHCWEDMNIPIKYNPIKLGEVTISNDVWIGCGCRILSNTKIKSRVVIAAGAVTPGGELSSNSIFGGVPCKKIKNI